MWEQTTIIVAHMEIDYHSLGLHGNITTIILAHGAQTTILLAHIGTTQNTLNAGHIMSS